MLRIWVIETVFVILLGLFCACRMGLGQREDAYTEEDVRFYNAIDGVHLAGTLTVPTSRPGPVPAVILIAGSGPHTRDLQFGKHRLFLTIADYLTRRGIAVLRYDKRGCGQSTGTYEPHDIEGFTKDALAAVDFLEDRDEIDTARIGALGISQGGLIAPRLAVRSANVGFIVVLGAPGVWGKEFAYASSVALARASGHGEVDVARLKELYDALWPLYTKPELTESETREAKRLLAEIGSFVEPESRSLLKMDDPDGHFALLRSPHILESMDDNPADVLRLVQCPVLALYGSKDVQIPPGKHLPAFKRALQEGGNRAFQVEELQDMNHVFQRSHTGLPSEYLTNEEAVAPEALEIITDWILAVTSSGF